MESKFAAREARFTRIEEKLAVLLRARFPLVEVTSLATIPTLSAISVPKEVAPSLNSVSTNREVTFEIVESSTSDNNVVMFDAPQLFDEMSESLLSSDVVAVIVSGDEKGNTDENRTLIPESSLEIARVQANMTTTFLMPLPHGLNSARYSVPFTLEFGDFSYSELGCYKLFDPGIGVLNPLLFYTLTDGNKIGFRGDGNCLRV